MKSLYIKNSFKLLGLTCALLLGTASCSDLLKETVVSSISNDYIATTPGFVAATNAAYTPLRSFYATERGISMSEYGTDIYSAGADGSYKGFHFYDSQLTSSVDNGVDPESSNGNVENNVTPATSVSTFGLNIKF